MVAYQKLLAWHVESCMGVIGFMWLSSAVSVFFHGAPVALTLCDCPPRALMIDFGIVRTGLAVCLGGVLLCPLGSVSMQRKHVSWRPGRLCPGPLWRCLTPYSNLPGCFFLDLSHFSALECLPFKHKQCLAQHHWVVKWLSMSLFWRRMPVG